MLEALVVAPQCCNKVLQAYHCSPILVIVTNCYRPTTADDPCYCNRVLHASLSTTEDNPCYYNRVLQATLFLLHCCMLHPELVTLLCVTP